MYLARRARAEALAPVRRLLSSRGPAELPKDNLRGSWPQRHRSPATGLAIRVARHRAMRAVPGENGLDRAFPITARRGSLRRTGAGLARHRKESPARGARKDRK